MKWIFAPIVLLLCTSLSAVYGQKYDVVYHEDRTEFLGCLTIADASTDSALGKKDGIVVNVTISDITLRYDQNHYADGSAHSDGSDWRRVLDQDEGLMHYGNTKFIAEESWGSGTGYPIDFVHIGRARFKTFIFPFNLKYERWYYLYSATITFQVQATSYLPSEMVIHYPECCNEFPMVHRMQLVPQKQNVDLGGAITLNPGENQDAVKRELQIFSAAEIAIVLNLTEEDVISLIKTNKLNGKLVGNTYFIRKVDLDNFMVR